MLRIVVAALLTTSPTLTSAQAQGPSGAVEPVDTAFQDTPSPFPAQRRVLGYGRLTSNDLIGDGQDRWRTGSVTMSRAWGYSWSGTSPAQFGELLETRIQGQIFAPDNLAARRLADRPYGAALSFGVHTHFITRDVEYAVGVDLVVVGAQTRFDKLQTRLHALIGKPEPSSAILALQVANQIRPGFVAEMGRSFRLGQQLDIRPFAELRAGDETMARVGADLTFGTVTRGELLSRESVTGQRYRLIYRSEPGFSFVVGGDLAFVSDSIYLPEARGYQVTTRRKRARAGLHWQGENASLFYGVTYLGREFKAQPEGQVVGSVRLKLSF